MVTRKPERHVLMGVASGRTFKAGAQRLGVPTTTLFRWLREEGIERGEVAHELPPAWADHGRYRERVWLVEQYEELGKSISTIAAEIRSTPNTILRWMRRLKIPRRDPSEANMLAARTSPKRRRVGEEHPLYKGGRFISRTGYVMVYSGKGHRYVPEHRKVMAEHLGRPLSKMEIVHHINGNKQDNRLDNLRLLEPHQHSGTLHLSEQLRYERAENARLRALLDANGISHAN